MRPENNYAKHARKWISRTRVKTAIALLLAAAFVADSQENHSPVGRWRTLSTSRGGIGATFTFHSDGAVELATSAIVESKCRLERDRLTTPGSVNGQEAVEIIESLSAKTIRMRMTQAADFQMRRDAQRPDSGNSILGSWKDSGGKGGEWEFFPDGRIAMTGRRGDATTVTERGQYNLTGKQLRVEFEHSAMNASLELDGDTQVLRITSMELIKEMVREGSPSDPKNLLVGTWTWDTRLPSGPVLFEYRANGSMLMIAPLRTDKGRYTVTGDHIRLEIEGRPVAEGVFRWDGPLLVMPGPRGEGESRLERY